MEINPETLEIEIVGFEPIEGGVQVFARAWSDGQQIGFGADGSVDIERFKIINPPILVPDENGDIIFVQEENLEFPIQAVTLRYREDPLQAVLASITETLKSCKSLHDSSYIEINKRGNTTTTVYAGTSDGYVSREDSNTWATQVSSATGTNVDSASTQNVGAYVSRRSGANAFNFYRAFFNFDTSSISSGDTVSSATFSLYSYANAAIFDNDANAICVVQESTSGCTLTTADYDAFTGGSLGSLALSSFTANSYANITMSTSSIVKAGTTKYCAREGHDFNNDTYSGAELSSNGILIRYADYSGTTNDPKLVVEHTAGGGGNTTNFFYMT